MSGDEALTIPCRTICRSSGSSCRRAFDTTVRVRVTLPDIPVVSTTASNACSCCGWMVMGRATPAADVSASDPPLSGTPSPSQQPSSTSWTSIRSTTKFGTAHPSHGICTVCRNSSRSMAAPSSYRHVTTSSISCVSSKSVRKSNSSSSTLTRQSPGSSDP